MIVEPDIRVEREPEVDVTFDVIVIGAGFGGLYMLRCLQELGVNARCYEAGGDVGGTWYWNRYPGARCDVPSLQYSYSFSEELEQEWDWSEKYAPQPEILAYARHVADRFDLRRDIRFDTRVTTARFDEQSNRWRVETDRGDVATAPFVVTAMGCLSNANVPDFEGIDDFDGPIYHTGKWPHDGVDFSGLKVGVIGTGSSAIQSIPIIAEQAEKLTVFQRTPNYSVPAWNEELDPEYRRKVKEDYPELRARARSRPTGVYFQFDLRKALETPEEERERQYEEYWQRGGLPFLGAFADLLFDKRANDTIADFARDKIRALVEDPQTADLLCPDNVFGCKRLCVDTNYYQTYNRPNVELVDVSKTPIERFTKTGLEVGGKAYDVDAVVCATGFAAMTGAFDKMHIVGRDGLTLKEKWAAGPRTYLGLTTVGFPNMFMITGPGSPSVLASMIQAIEQHADWITDCIAHCRAVGVETIEPTLEEEDAWVEHVNEVAAASLRSTCSSWYVGANIPGRPRVFMPYIGGFPRYVEKCNDVASDSYTDFVLKGEGMRNRRPEFRWTKRWRVKPMELSELEREMRAGPVI
ncbi:MAG: NAD(P)/FAD-dependent oxidoreductase [Alphaproteobacteria bacterium]